MRHGKLRMRRGRKMEEQPDPPGLEDWDPWHPNELFLRLQTVEAPWYVAGGWALDLWHGFETRRHEDIEIAVLRSDFGAFRRKLPEMQFFCAGGGQFHRLTPGFEPPDSVHQVWCLDARTRRWKLDIMLEQGTVEKWVFRRNDEIWRPRSEMIGKTSDGLPFLNPAGVLLFKAKQQRAKDELDFARAVGKLAGGDRRWLRAALERAHPGHEWISQL